MLFKSDKPSIIIIEIYGRHFGPTLPYLEPSHMLGPTLPYLDPSHMLDHYHRCWIAERALCLASAGSRATPCMHVSAREATARHMAQWRGLPTIYVPLTLERAPSA